MPQRTPIGSPNLKNNHVVRNLARDYQQAQRHAYNSQPPRPFRDRRAHPNYVVVRQGPAAIAPCRRCGRIGLIDPFLGVCTGTRMNPRLIPEHTALTFEDLLKIKDIIQPRRDRCKKVGKVKRARHAWAVR